jgi:hypothetical protein
MMEMNDWRKELEEENARLIAEYLEKGGKVTQVELGLRTESADPKKFWGGRPKKKPTAEDPFPGKPKPKKK